MKLLWQQIASTTITEILCSSSLDGVVLDLEHGCFNDSDIFQSIQIASLMNKKVLARITCIEERLIRMMLDAGVDGLILSTVEDSAEFNRLKNLCQYPSSGIRGQGLVRENAWGEKPFSKRQPLVIPQIETQKGVYEACRSTSFCNGPILVGPYDLSASCGDVGNFDNPTFKEFMNKLIDNFGTRMGYHIVKDIELQLPNLKESEFLAFGIDTLFLINGVKNIESIIY